MPASVVRDDVERLRVQRLDTVGTTDDMVSRADHAGIAVRIRFAGDAEPLPGMWSGAVEVRLRRRNRT